MNDDTNLVLGVIQKGYQDATSTVLDRMVSQDIVEALRGAGWATPEEVRAIVAAAGGRVSVPFDVMMDPPDILYREKDMRNDATILTTKRSAGVSR